MGHSLAGPPGVAQASGQTAFDVRRPYVRPPRCDTRAAPEDKDAAVFDASLTRLGAMLETAEAKDAGEGPGEAAGAGQEAGQGAGAGGGNSPDAQPAKKKKRRKKKVAAGEL